MQKNSLDNERFAGRILSHLTFALDRERMLKQLEFNWRLDVPEELQSGFNLDRIDEVGDLYVLISPSPFSLDGQLENDKSMMMVETR